MLTHLDDLVILIVNPQDARYGQLAKLTEHDWKDSGLYLVEFLDGKMEIYPDDGSTAKAFYRHNDPEGKELNHIGCGPRNLTEVYLDLERNDLHTLARDYKKLFGKEFHDNYFL